MVQQQTLEDKIKTSFEVVDGKLLRKATYKQWKKGSESGSAIGKRGYKTISILGKRLYVHRGIYWLHYGTWPDLVDHINGNKTDNRPENLRSLCKSGNARNIHKAHKDSESGKLGILLRKDTGKYSVRFQGKNLGCFESLEEAENVYDTARNERFA